MASWMIHLRIADKLLDRISDLSPIEFIMGNMAPDSGVPNEDWTQFFPSTKVSHFRTDDGSFRKEIDLDAYLNRYFTSRQRAGYNEKQYSFYLGYYTHLLTDCLWTKTILAPSRDKFASERAADKAGWIARMKADWYDLDFLYLKKHPGFRAFRVYLGAVGFVNTYLDFFSPDAFDNRRAYITNFYLQKNDHIEREYTYLTEAEADRFVKQAVEEILRAI